MALVAITGGYTQFIGSVRMEGSWTGNNLNDIVFCYFQWGYGAFSNSTSGLNFTEEEGTYTRTPLVDRDRTIKFRARVCIEVCNNGLSSGEFKTYADSAIFPIGLNPGVPTTISCPVTGTVKPRTVESVGDVYIEYRKQGTGSWLEVPTPVLEDISGSAAIAVNGDLGGLLPATTYEARFKIVRNTENETVNYSAVGTFTTASSSTTIVSAQVMHATAQMISPIDIQVGSPGSRQVNVFAVLMEAEAEMLLPAVYVSQQAIIELFVQFNDVISREAIFG